MYKLAVYSVHGIIFLFATFSGLAGVYNISDPDTSRNFGIWFTAIAVYNIFIIVSAYIQLRLRKKTVFLITIIALFLLFYFLPHIVLYIETTI